MELNINYKMPLAYYEIANVLSKNLNKDTIIVCIGTDKFIGDCLGPLIGTMLKEYKFPLKVYGTLDDPIHALNLDSKMNEIHSCHKDSTIIGIDACLGSSDSIGDIHIREIPISPGKGVGKTLRSIGDLSIVGIVEDSENKDFFSSKTIRLSLIFNIAKTISRGLIHGYILNKK